MRYPEEPHTLVNGVAVHSGAVSLLAYLHEHGHTISLDADGHVQVDRVEELNENRQHLLDAFDEDLAILLRVGDPTVH